MRESGSSSGINDPRAGECTLVSLGEGLAFPSLSAINEFETEWRFKKLRPQ
jgi:hypothetical protein